MKALKPTKFLRIGVLFIVCIYAPPNLHAQDATFEWVKTMGGSSQSSQCYGNSIVTDAAGNIYTAGSFQYTVDFDPGPDSSYLTANGSTSSSSRSDLFVQKLDPAGNFLWAIQIGNNDDVINNRMAIDQAGNLYMTGFFTGTVDFDPGPGIYNLASNGSGYDIFILKLNSNGNFLWAKKTGGTAYDLPSDITVDVTGNVIVTGRFRGTVDFNPGAGVSNITSNGQADFFILKLDASGNFLWAKGIGASGDEDITSVTTDAPGNICVAGYFTYTVDFNPGPGVFNLIAHPTLPNAAYAILKLDANGNFVWAYKPEIGLVWEIAFDANGALYLAGDAAVQKSDANGNILWEKQPRSAGLDGYHSITLDSQGHLYLTGEFHGTVDFDPSPSAHYLLKDEGIIFLQKLDANGNLIWVNAIKTPLGSANSVKIDANGNICTTGDFRGLADFDPQPDTFNIQSVGTYEIFVHKMSQKGVYGFAFYDMDEDCVKDADDIGLGGRQLVINPGNIIVQTNNSGVWSIDSLPPGGYTITADTTENRPVACSVTRAFNVTNSNGITVGPSFGFISPCETMNGNTGVSFDSITGCREQRTQLEAFGGINYWWAPSDDLSDIFISNPIILQTQTAGYTVVIQDSSFCVDTFTVAISADFYCPCDSSANNGVTFDTASICPGDSVQLSAYGGTVTFPPWQNVYSWFPSSGLSSTITANPIAYPSVTTTYTVTIRDTVACVDTFHVTVVVNPCGTCNSSFTYTNSGTTYNFQNTSTGSSLSYLWLFGDVTSSTSANPTHQFVSGVYNVCLIISNTSGCSDTTCNIITVNNQSLVWPGDANSDGIANNQDVLAIGIGYGISGFTRPNASLNWVGQPSPDWALQLAGGANLKHVDCNGDAIINASDTLAISLNYGLVHAKSSGSGRLTDPPLYVDLPDTLYAGQTVSAPINLGSASNMVIGIYGIAFDINYDTGIVDTNSVDVSYDNSWMGTPGVNLLGFSKDFYSNAKTDVAITRINHVNAAQNYGQIGTFSFTIKDDVSGKRLMDIPFEISIGNVLAIAKDENIIPVSGERDSSVVVMIESGVTNTIRPFIRIYPNPADEMIYIEANEQIHKITLTDMIGRKIRDENIQNSKAAFDIKAFSKGTYLLRLEFENSVEYKKILIQ